MKNQTFQGELFGVAKPSQGKPGPLTNEHFVVMSTTLVGAIADAIKGSELVEICGAKIIRTTNTAGELAAMATMTTRQ